jgi:hypothetical protein
MYKIIKIKGDRDRTILLLPTDTDSRQYSVVFAFVRLYYKILSGLCNLSHEPRNCVKKPFNWMHL